MNIPVTRRTLARLILLTVGGLGFALLIPVFVPVDPDAPIAHLAVAVFTVVIIAALFAEASRRRQKLFEAVRVELNKLRRIYHVSKNIAETSPKFRPWFTELHGRLYEYLTMFSGKDFGAYDGFNAGFRKLSYHIYTIPDVDTKKEEALFQDLLRTTATVAEARQQIKELWDNRLSAYGWTAVLLIATGYAVTAVLAMSDTLVSRVAGGISIVVALIALDMLWEVDTMASERRAMAKRYVDNVARLELGRKETV